MAGYYPSRAQAQAMVALQAQPYDYPDPPMGDPPPLIWKVTRRDEGWAAEGYTLEELRAL